MTGKIVAKLEWGANCMRVKLGAFKNKRPKKREGDAGGVDMNMMEKDLLLMILVT